MNRSMKYKGWIQLFLIMAALGSVAFGMIRNEQMEVLKKAVNICLECIGIG